MKEHGLPVQLKHLGNLIGFFQNEIGTLNQVVHLWGFDDLNERQRRRRALMSEPKLLMLDEPSLGLAPAVVETLDIADYAYVLQTGRTVLEGKPSELEKNEQVQEIYLGIKSGASGLTAAGGSP